MSMVKASYAPSEYQSREQESTSEFFSSGRAESVPSVFCSTTSENGWKLTRYKTASQKAEDEADIRDSLEALKEPSGISLEDLKRELDV
jgi:hypothetical protein